MIEQQYKFRSRMLDYILLVIALIAAVTFAYARISGQRVRMQDGNVSRRAVPSIMFMGEKLNTELRVGVANLPTCGLQVSNDPIYAVLVMDTSGTMQGLPLASAKAAATEFVDLLDMDFDRVGLVQFDDRARSSLRGKFSTSREDVLRGIERMKVGNQTNMGAGLQEAYEMIQAAEIPPNAERLLILLSDGMPNVGADPIPVAQRIRDDTSFRVIAVAMGNADQGYLGQLTENPTEEVLVADEANNLVIKFGEIAERYVNSLATDIQVTENYNNQDFEIVLFSARTADASQPGVVAWQWPFLGSRGRNAGYQLRPRKMGNLKVVDVPGNVTMKDCNGESVSQTLPTGPAVLVLFPWWIFIIIGALFLLWLLFRLLEEIRFGTVRIGPPAPAPPQPFSTAPPANPTNRDAINGDWHGKKDK
jgi:uncharacterized protein YegL